MNRLVDHYPETLRDIYDKLVETIAELQATSPVVDVAFYATEWVRTNWSGRLLIPGWWGICTEQSDADRTGTLPGISVAIDPVRSERGRDLRLAVWEIMAVRGLPRSCHVATAIAARVEAEWSGDKIYVPKAKQVDRAIRDARIWREFGGLPTVDRIIHEHKISQSDVYRIFRRLQKDKDAREQLTLF